MFLILTIFKSHLFNKRFIKSISSFFLFVLLIIVYLYKKNKMSKLLRKISSLSINLQNIINNYISDIPPRYKYEIEQEKNKLVALLSLLNYSSIINISLKYELKKKLLKELQIKSKHKNLSEIKYVFVEKALRYGNSIVLLNNLLYYCEILNITNIYLNSNQDWPIIENITLDTFNISLVNKKNINLNDRSITSFHKNYIYYQRIIKPEIRIDKFEYEIKRNLPKVIIDQKDLYIHIRSGDIFKYKSNKSSNYAQPPLCFYEKILNQFKFRKIFIITENNLNPIINLLIKRFQTIIVTNNSLKVDIALLMNAYNIVGSISSFLTMIIIFNEHLLKLWEYDLYRLPEKYFHLHRDFYTYKKKYIIYKMIPSKKYKTMMFPWRNTKEQREYMIQEKCGNFKFIPTKSK